MAKEVYFDNAATMTKIPEAVQAEADYYREVDANALRGLYDRGVKATEMLESSRRDVAEFVGAKASQIVFTRGATEGLNMVANGLDLSDQDLILVGINNHHSNILPWTERYKNVKVTENILEDPDLVKARVVAMCGMSNVTGKSFIKDVLEARRRAEKSILVVDAAQLAAHADLAEIVDAVDFLAFSGHKIGAPMGIGVLYGKDLGLLKPMHYGGEMVESVNYEDGCVMPELAVGPQKFEGGTLNMGGIAGLAAAARYWNNLDKKAEFAKVDKLTKKLVAGLKPIPFIKVYAGENGIVSFNVDGVHPHDTAQVLNHYKIDVRAGYHCAQPFCISAGFGPVVRASLSIFNTEDEVDYFVKTIKKVREDMGL